MKLHEVLFAPCLSARPLFSCHRSIARASARASVAGPLLVCHWSARVVVAVLSLVCCWSVTRPSARASARVSLVHLLVRLLVRLSLVRLSLVCHSCVCHSSVTRLSLVHLLVRLLVCLLVRLLVRLSLIHLFLHRSSIAHPSVPPSLLHRSSICSSIAPPSLIHLFLHLFLHRSSICSSIAHPSVPPSFLHRSSICSCVCHSSVAPLSHSSLTGLSVRSSLVCLLVHLLGSGSLPRGWSATRLSPIRRWSWSFIHLLVRRALLCPLLSCLLFCHQSVCCSVTSPSARASLVHLLPVAGLSAHSSLVHLFGSWSLVCLFGSCIAHPSDSLIIRLVVHRSSPIPLRWSVAGPSSRHSSARLLVLLFESWSLVRRSSVCSSITGASAGVRFACRWSVTGL